MKSIKRLINKVALRVIVSSMTNSNTKYIVKNIFGSWSCTCPDCQIRERECKHIKAVKTGRYPVGKVYSY
jgi:hypothetical protein